MSLLTNGGDFIQGPNTSINNVDKEISATDTNTTYSAGTGVILSGTAFLNPSFNFSLSEQVVGKWIDGKTIYQKTFNFGALPNASVNEKKVKTDLKGSNLTCIQLFGYSYGGSTLLPIPHAGANKSTTQIAQGVVNVTMRIFPEDLSTQTWTLYLNKSSGQDLSMYTETYITVLYTK